MCGRFASFSALRDIQLTFDLDALGPEWKPSVSGFVLHSENGGQRLIVESDAARPHDWRREPYHQTLRRWAEAPGQEVLIFAGNRGVRLGVTDMPVRRA